MQPHRQRRFLYAAGLALSLFMMASVVTDAPWVFRLFLALKNRTITLDTNRDGRDDYWEYWVDGKLAKSEWDLDYNGGVDFINRFQDGVLTLLELDEDHDGYFEYREVLEPENHRYRHEKDPDKHGRFAVLGYSDAEPGTQELN